MSSVFTVDRGPLAFVSTTPDAGSVYQIPTALLSDEDRTFQVTQALVSVDGDSNTIMRYRIDGAETQVEVAKGHFLTHGDEIMLRNPEAIRNLRIYCQATGTGGAIRITLMG